MSINSLNDMINNSNNKKEKQYIILVKGNNIYVQKFEDEDGDYLNYKLIQKAVGWDFERVNGSEYLTPEFMYLQRKYNLIIRCPDLPIGDKNCLGLYGNLCITKQIEPDVEAEEYVDEEGFTLEMALKIKSKFDSLTDGGLLEEVLKLDGWEKPKNPKLAHKPKPFTFVSFNSLDSMKLVDICLTLLDIFNIKPDLQFQGKSLFI